MYIGQKKTKTRVEEEDEEEKLAPKSKVSLNSDSEENLRLFTQNLSVTDKDFEVILF